MKKAPTSKLLDLIRDGSVSEKSPVKEGTKYVDSTKNEASNDVPSEGTKNVGSTNNVDSTDNEASNDVPPFGIKEGTKNEDSTKNAPSSTAAGRKIRTNTKEMAAKPVIGLCEVEVQANFTKVDNDIHRLLKPIQLPLEYSIYDSLYNKAIRWKRNHCRVGTKKLMECCNIRDKRTLNNSIDGLVEKGHIQIINRNNKGTLYRIFFPQEIFDGENKTILKFSPINSIEDTNDVDSTDNGASNNVPQLVVKGGTKNVESTNNEGGTYIPPIIDLIDLKDLSLEPVKLFYTGIGQKRISKVRRERGDSVLQELQKEGFSPEDIQFAIQWTLKPENTKEKVHDFSIISHTIGQALSAREAGQQAAHATQKQVARVRAAEEEERRLEGEIQNLRDKLDEEGLADLRKRAEKEIAQTDGMKKEFINEPLIVAKENEILRRKNQ